MSRWPRDSQADLLAFYGTPGPQVEAQLVRVVPPFQMYYDGKPVAYIKFHKKAAGALAAALQEIWEHYGRDQKKIDALGISKYAGAYNPRYIRGSTTKWSNHAYGAAIDLNAEDNGFGAGHGNIPQPVIDAFKRQGARWGGDYHGRTDPMHFEFCDAGQQNVPPATPAPKPVAVPTPKPRPIEAPHADADQDAIDDAQGDADDAVTVQEPTAVAPPAVVPAVVPPAVEGSWLKRKWRGLTSWVGGGAATGMLGYLTSPWAIVAVFACLVIIAILIVWFMGPSDVRAWVRKQVS